MNTRKKKMLIALMTGSLMTGTVFAASASTPAEGQSIATSGVAHRTQNLSLFILKVEKGHADFVFRRIKKNNTAYS